MRYQVRYRGDNPKNKNFGAIIDAFSERDAVETVFSEYYPENYFPQKDDTILDAQGNIIAGPDDDEIKFDGGYFYAVEYWEGL